MAELQFIENPTIVVVPRPNRYGRYEFEFRPSAGESRCGHHSQQALLWLFFVEAGQETGREVSEVICAECDPARFARAQAWAATHS